MSSVPPGEAVSAGSSLAPGRWQVAIAAITVRKLFGALVVLFCGVAFSLTEPRFYADTANYALHIVQHWQGLVSPGRDPLWDFGHVIWKPLGFLLWRVTGGPQSSLPIVHAAHMLIAVSILATCLGALLLYLLCANYTGKAWVGFATAIGYVSTHAVLNYAQTGTSYIPGTVCQIAALFFIECQLRTGRERAAVTWLIPGIFLSLSVLLWFPYVLTVPGILLFALLYRPGDFGDRVSLILKTSAVVSLFVIAVYAMALFFNHITSVAMAHDWYLRSQYGKSQTRGYLRAVTGIPRGFLFLGDDGIMWKRLLFERTIGAHGLKFAWLVTAMTWKLIVVYAFLFIVLLELARRKEVRTCGQELLPVLLAAALPVLFFAIVLFEAGPPERYLPVFPILFLGAAHIVGYHRRFSRALILTFFVLMLAVNSVALSRAGSRGRWSATSAKLVLLERLSSHQDLLWVVSYQDDVFRMSEERPFDPLQLRAPYIRVVAELQSRSLAEWRQNVAAIILQSWRNGRQVWISKRLLASEPKPEWNWVEGDDTRIRWSDFPAFFRPLQTTASCCGEDGYVLLAKTPGNRLLLESLAANSGADRPPETR